MSVNYINLTQDDLQRISDTMKHIAHSTRQRVIYKDGKVTPGCTKMEAISFLKKDIKNLFDRKWTHRQVCDLLTEHGIEISVSTLSVYLKRLSR